MKTGPHNQTLIVLVIATTASGYLAIGGGCQTQEDQDTKELNALMDVFDSQSALSITYAGTSETRHLEVGSDLHTRVFEMLNVIYRPVSDDKTIRTMRGTYPCVLVQDGEERARIYMGPYVDVTKPDGSRQLGRTTGPRDLHHKLCEVLGLSEP